jgi:hypothetical protein
VIRLTRKQRFVRSAITSFGFLSGVWVHLGFDPQSWVHEIFRDLLVGAAPQYSQAITVLFFATPIIAACVALLGMYRHAGWFGLLALTLAFYAGLRLDVIGIVLLVIALAIGIFWTRTNRSH